MSVSKSLRGSGRLWVARASLVLVSATMLVLSACGAGNASVPKTTPGLTSIGNAGTFIPGVLKWGEDSTGGMPYIAPKDANNPNAADYGFEVDIASAMAKAMNVTQQPTQITWSDWPQGLSTHQFDFFMNGLEITPENAKTAKFSIPYYVYTQSIVVLKSTTTINSFADLAGKTVETGTDYKAQFIMEDWNAAHPSQKINIITTDTPAPFTDLDSYRAAAEFLDTPIAKWYGANDPSGKYKIVGGDLNPGYYGVAFDPYNPNTPTLLAEVNQAIAKMYSDGTLQKIYQDGGAYNSKPDGSPVFVKYDMWSSFVACIGNFLPTNPTHMAGCPELPRPSRKA